MKQSRFTKTQIVAILREADEGVAVTDVCRRYGISGNTFYNWKKKYSGMGVPELKRMKELETENTRLKRMYSEKSLENHALKELISKML
jgi:putative transposase